MTPFTSLVPIRGVRLRIFRSWVILKYLTQLNESLKIQSIKVFVDRVIVDNYNPSGFLLTRFWPFENASKSLTQEIQNDFVF